MNQRPFPTNVSKRALPFTLGLWLATLPAQAALESFSWNSGFAAGSGDVADGSTTGWNDTRVLSGITGGNIFDLDVTLQLAGGWNGDLYAYITHDSGFSILLNRVGRTSGDSFGYGDAGLNVRLDDAAAVDIHTYQSAPGHAAAIAAGGSFSPDARSSNPIAVLDTDPRGSHLSSFNDLDPNGSWTLFVADLSSGESTTVLSWGLEIQAGRPASNIPEGGNGALLLAVGLGGLVWARTKTQDHSRHRGKAS